MDKLMTWTKNNILEYLDFPVQKKQLKVEIADLLRRLDEVVETASPAYVSDSVLLRHEVSIN